jgi:hypothetical protein
MLSPNTRSKVIASLCAMFNDYHGNDVTPDWVLDLHHQTNDGDLVARLGNWRRNHPNEFARHGYSLYVM